MFVRNLIILNVLFLGVALPFGMWVFYTRRRALGLTPQGLLWFLRRMRWACAAFGAAWALTSLIVDPLAGMSILALMAVGSIVLAIGLTVRTGRWVGGHLAAGFNAGATQAAAGIWTTIVSYVTIPSAAWLLVALPVAGIWAAMGGDPIVYSSTAILGKWRSEDGVIIEILQDATIAEHLLIRDLTMGTDQVYAIHSSTENVAYQGELTISPMSGENLTPVQVTVTRKTLEFLYSDGETVNFNRPEQ